MRDEDILRALDRVFARPEFEEPWSARIQREIFEAVEKLLHRLADAPGIVQVVVILVLLVVLVYLVWELISSYQRIVRMDAQVQARAREELRVRTPSELLDDAVRLAGAGKPRAAARALQQGMLLLRCERAKLTWEPSRTDGEWLARFGRPPELVRFTRDTQRIAYSEAPLELLSACEAQLRAELAS